MFGSRNAFLTAARAALDPFFNYVTLLLTGNGTNGAQNNTFLDSSTNNFTITRNGNTTQGTFTPYGPNWSNYFDGSGDYLSIPDAASWVLGNNFTIECWVYFTSTSGIQQFINQRASSASAWQFLYNFPNSGDLTFKFEDGNIAINRNWAPIVGQWYHIAVTRNGSTWYLFSNGVQLGATATNSTTFPDIAATIWVGTLQNPSGESFNGYMSNLRVTKSSVYTTNFTPSTTPLTANANTQLLTCADNRFIDDSANNFTITRNGDVNIQRFSPFSPTAPYAGGAISGSGYFDGNGDFLTAPANAAFNFGTGNFTVEGWVYPTSTSGTRPIVEIRTSAANSTGFALLSQSGATTLNVFTNGVFVGASTNSLITNAWNHIALVRNGNTWTYWINGVSGGSFTNSSTQSDGSTTGPKIGGSTTAGEVWVGYLSDIRLLKGTALYTTTFTPPTAPLTAITNTSLLLSYTNGGIIDNAMMNDLETVGNAQISTSVSKFGGGSIAFDGSGDNLFAPSSQNLNMTSGDWTIEMWVYISNRTTNYPLVFGNNRGAWTTDALALSVSNADNAAYNDKFVFAWNNGGFSSPSAGTSQLLVANVTNATATWYHFAAVRNGTSIRMYRNGIQVASATILATAAFNWGFNGTLLGGGNWDGAQGNFNGYLDDVRVTKGYARYTANFTPPSAPFPLQ